MITKEYSEAMVEVFDVLQNLDEESISRIPLDFIKYLNKNKSKTYKSNIDFSKELKENELKHETKVMLALIYRDYMCETDEERKEFEDTLAKPSNKVNEIFPTKLEEADKKDKMIVFEQEKSMFKKILNKFFSKK